MKWPAAHQGGSWASQHAPRQHWPRINLHKCHDSFLEALLFFRGEAYKRVTADARAGRDPTGSVLSAETTFPLFIHSQQQMLVVSPCGRVAAIGERDDSCQSLTTPVQEEMWTPTSALMVIRQNLEALFFQPSPCPTWLDWNYQRSGGLR